MLGKTPGSRNEQNKMNKLLYLRLLVLDLSKAVMYEFW